jgi:hypothetical protein
MTQYSSYKPLQRRFFKVPESFECQHHSAGFFCARIRGKRWIAVTLLVAR